VTASPSERDARWRNSITRALVPASILYALLSGFRLPSRWATTNLIVDYHFGFTKRGLFGQLLDFLKAPPYPYAFLAALAYGIFLVSLGLLIHLFCKGREVSGRSALLFAGFFTSVGFVFLVHEVGYLDHIGLLIAVICLLTGSSYAGICIRLALCVFGILVHEAFMLMFLPVVLADTWLATRPSGARGSVLRVLTVAIPCVLLGVHMGHYKAQTPQDAQVAYYNGKLSDSQVREDAIEPMRLSLSDNLQLMAYYYHEAKYLRTFAATMLVVAPLTVFYLWIVNSILIDAGVRVLGRLIFMAASLAPLALNIVAWDEVRFISLVQVTSFLLVLSVTRRMGWRTLAGPRLRELAVPAVAVIALSLGSEVTLFDGYAMQKFPFTNDLRSFVKALNGSAPLIGAPAN
jgi:hypothetical protein